MEEFSLHIGRAIVRFRDFSGMDLATLRQKGTELQPYFARMPESYLSAITPVHVYIVTGFPGGRSFGGGGYYPQGEMANWQNREQRTGVPNAYLNAPDFPYGLVAVLSSKLTNNAYHFTVMHEVMHMVDHRLHLSERLTLAQLAGIRYGRIDRRRGVWVENSRIGEYFAEAYARYLINPNSICRTRGESTIEINGREVVVELPDMIPPGQTQSTCSARIRTALESL